MNSSLFWVALVAVSAILVIILFLAMVFEKRLEDRLRAIRSIYTYAVSFISLGVMLFGFGTLAYTALSYSVFPKALNEVYSYRLSACETYPAKVDPVGTATGSTMNEDRQQCLDRETKAITEEKEGRFQSQMLSGIIMLVIAFPVYVFHFFVLRRKENA